MDFPVFSRRNREFRGAAGRDGFAVDCVHNHAVAVSQTISGSAPPARERPAFPARHARTLRESYLRDAGPAALAAEMPALSLQAISTCTVGVSGGASAAPCLGWLPPCERVRCADADDSPDRDLPAPPWPVAGPVQTNPSALRWSCQSVGMRVSCIRRDAVRFAGWQPRRMASTMSGASQARRTSRVA